MKKFTLLIIITITLGAMFVQSCSNAGAVSSKDGTNNEKQASLQDMGFVHVKSIMKAFNDTHRKYWEDKYQIQFVSDIDMTDMTVDHTKMIIGKAINYTGDIPKDAAIRIANNYNKIKDEKIYYFTEHPSVPWQVVGKDWLDQKNYDDKGIMVMAPPDLFQPGADITIKRDPMAIVKVDYGYVVLAAW